MARHSENIEYTKRDFLYHAGVWRGAPKDSLVEIKHSPKVLVFGHSDYSLSCVDLARIAISIRPGHVYASNMDCPFSLAGLLKATPIPLGLSNPTDESKVHKVLGNLSHFEAAYRKAPKVPPPESRKLYLNFSVANARKERKKVLKVAAGIESAVVRSPEITDLGRVEYLAEMRKAGLVVCPRGNGLDTHRFYEALLMGAIPIVLRSSYANRVGNFFQLPKLAVSSWSQLRDVKRLQQQSELLDNSFFDLAKIRGSYWLNLLKS